MWWAPDCLDDPRVQGPAKVPILLRPNANWGRTRSGPAGGIPEEESDMTRAVAAKICEGPGCTNIVPKGRWKFCCTLCGKNANRNKHKDVDYGPILRKRSTKMGLRTCLGCNEKFLSEGPWNRMCPACSDRQAAVPAHSAGGMEAVL